MIIRRALSVFLLVFSHSLFSLSLRAQTSSDQLLNLEATIDSLYQKGETKKILPLARKAFQIAQQRFERTDSLYTHYLSTLTFFLSQNGLYEEAEPLMQENLTLLAKTVGINHEDYGMALNNLSAMYIRMGYFEEAEPLLIQSMKLWEGLVGKEHQYYVITLNNLASLYDDLEQYEEAEKRYYQVLEIYRKILGSEHLLYASALNNLAYVYAKMNKYIAAEPLHREVIKIYELKEREEHPEYASAKHNLAVVLQKLGMSKEAEELHKEAIAIKQKTLGNVHPSYLNGLNLLVNFYLETKQVKKAYPVLQQAFNKNTKTPIQSSFEQADFFDAIAKQKFYYTDVALQSLNLLLSAFEQSYRNTQQDKWLSQTYLGTNAALQLLVKYRQNFNAEKDRLQLQMKAPEFSEKGLSSIWLLQSNRSQPELKEFAFFFMEEAKASAIAQAIRSKQAYRFGEVPDSLAILENQLAKKQKELYSQFYTLQEQKVNISLSEELIQVNNELAQLHNLLEREFPKYFQFKYGQKPVKIQEIQAQLADDQVLIEYFIADAITLALSITKKSTTLTKIEISKEQVNKDIKSLRHILSDYGFIQANPQLAYQNYTDLANKVYQNLVQDVVNQLPKEIKHLIIVPDNILNYLPFEVLLKKKANVAMNYSQLSYLINDYKISYSYAAKLWSENMKKNISNNNQLLGMAAIYDGSTTQTPVLRSTRLRQIRGILQDLPSARKEVAQLENLFQGSFHYKREATEKIFKEQASNFGVLHLAMHSILSPKTPILSGLLFSETAKDSTVGHLLQSYEISQMNIPANLVVLSACETGFGQIKSGEGILSIARSFMHAGASSLVVSLWQIDDASTATLMKCFYKALAKGKDKATALQQAKLEYLKTASAEKAHPAYWSSFIQIGDSRPIKLQIKTSKTYYIWILLAAFIVGGVFMLQADRKNRKKE